MKTVHSEDPELLGEKPWMDQCCRIPLTVVELSDDLVEEVDDRETVEETEIVELQESEQTLEHDNCWPHHSDTGGRPQHDWTTESRSSNLLRTELEMMHWDLETVTFR